MCDFTDCRALAIPILALSLLLANGCGSIATDSEVKACKEAIVEGKEMGKTVGVDKSWEDCRRLTMILSDNCQPDVIAAIPCVFRAEAFFEACLEVAEPSDGFCDGVPHPDDIFKTVLYTVRLCKEAERRNLNACAKSIDPLMQFCVDLDKDVSGADET
jgi:hypothetical protein